MSSARQQIESLHAAYQALTGHSIFLNMTREMEWFAWLRFRRPPFTEEDLRLVVAHLKRGIQSQKRNPGALKFSNLIGSPDFFEEDLSEARARSRPLPPAMKTVRTGNTQRIIPATGAEDRARSAADVVASIEKLKEAAK